MRVKRNIEVLRKANRQSGIARVYHPHSGKSARGFVTCGKQGGFRCKTKGFATWTYLLNAPEVTSASCRRVSLWMRVKCAVSVSPKGISAAKTCLHRWLNA